MHVRKHFVLSVATLLTGCVYQSVRRLFPVLLGAGLLAGCTTSRPFSGLETLNRDREAEFYWGRTTYLALNAAIVAGTPESWCQEANDKLLKPEKRRMAAALLFGGWVQPGFTTEKIRTAIPDPRWLDECSLNGIALVGGRWPFLFEGSHFGLDLFPDDKEIVGWTIEFTLPFRPNSRAARSVEEAAAFLRGTHPDKSLQIREFIMMYPLPGRDVGGYVEEAHGPKGVGIRIFPPALWGDE